jgi:hypothetical protein
LSNLKTVRFATWLPLSGQAHREARDVALADLAELLIEAGIVVEAMTRSGDQWRVNYVCNA